MKYLTIFFMTTFSLCTFLQAEPAKKCRFGDSISEVMENNPLYQTAELENATVTIPDDAYNQLFELNGSSRHTLEAASVQIIDKATQEEFMMYYSVRDEDDGGNSWGWVTRTRDNAVVALIGDSWFYNCQVVL